MDRPQPVCRPREEAERRHDIERRGEIEAAEPGADQAHVVIERQPADEDIGRTRFDRVAHRPDIGEQIGVAQHDALRIAGAAGRILNQRGRLSLKQGRATSALSSSVPTLSTDSRLSTCARSSPASGSPSGMVTSIFAPALRRMPA